MQRIASSPLSTPNLPHSALFGHPPNNQDDWYIIRGFARLLNIPDELFDPSMGLPPTVMRPPNFHYTSRGPSIAASAAVAIFLIIVITGTRLYLRFFRRDLKIGWDDFLVIPAALLTIAEFALSISLVTYGGAGKHLYDITYQELNWLFGGSLITIVVFWMAVGFTKLSIVFFNRRLTGLTSHRWTVVHYIFLFCVVSFMIVALFVELFSCTGPIDLKYSLLAKGRHPTNNKCIDGNKKGYSLAVVHSFLDFCLLSIPLIILYRMSLTLSNKIRLMLLFSVGLISCIGSVMRQVVQTQQLTSPDSPWDYQNEYSWIAVDIFFGITVASLPVLNAIMPKRWRSSGNGTPQLNHFSIFNSKSEGSRSAKLDSNEDVQRPDGTTRDEEEYAGRISEVEKDSFNRRTEKRWDQAFVQKPDAVLDSEVGIGTKRSDDTLV